MKFSSSVFLSNDIIAILSLSQCVSDYLVINYVVFRIGFAFSLTILTDMARVYNWDVKRRNKDDSTKNKA